MCCRAPSIPEAQDLSRSSSNASSFASVIEEHDDGHEAEEEDNAGPVRGDEQSHARQSKAPRRRLPVCLVLLSFLVLQERGSCATPLKSDSFECGSVVDDNQGVCPCEYRTKGVSSEGESFHRAAINIKVTGSQKHEAVG